MVYHPLLPVHFPGEVYRYMIGKVCSDLPALAALDVLTTEITGTLAGALWALTQAGSSTLDDIEDQTTCKPKSVQEVYNETYQTLMRFCNVGHPDEVAPVWGRLANCTKSEQHTILVHEFQRVCMARGLSLTKLCMLIVTAALKQMIMGFQFVGHGVDKLSTGCQPFQVAYYAGSANPLQAVAAASIGNQQAQGKQSASLANYWILQDKEKVKFPQDTLEVSVMLG